MNSETFSLIYILKTEIKQKIVQKNLASIPKQLRHFMSVCNSVGIQLLQSKSFTEFSFVLKKSLKADQWLFKYGNQADRLWQGRLILFLIYSYFSLITKDLKNSMKCLYQAHSLIEDIKDSGGILTNDLKIVINFVSFIVLWKAERIKQANEFLKISSKVVEASRSVDKISRINLAAIESFIKIGIAAVLIKVDGNFVAGKKLALEVVKLNFRDLEIIEKIVKDFLKNIDQVCDNAFFSEFNSTDILLSHSFEEGILEICLVPFISENTPVVKERNENLSITNRIRARILSFSDKISTKSSSKSKYEPENYNPKLAELVKQIERKNNQSEVRKYTKRRAVYSPVLGVLRPKTVFKIMNAKLLKRRPKSQGKCIY